MGKPRRTGREPSKWAPNEDGSVDTPPVMDESTGVVWADGIATAGGTNARERDEEPAQSRQKEEEIPCEWVLSHRMIPLAGSFYARHDETTNTWQLLEAIGTRTAFVGEWPSWSRMAKGLTEHFVWRGIFRLIAVCCAVFVFAYLWGDYPYRDALDMRRIAGVVLVTGVAFLLNISVVGVRAVQVRPLGELEQGLGHSAVPAVCFGWMVRAGCVLAACGMWKWSFDSLLTGLPRGFVFLLAASGLLLPFVIPTVCRALPAWDFCICFYSAGAGTEQPIETTDTNMQRVPTRIRWAFEGFDVQDPKQQRRICVGAKEWLNTPNVDVTLPALDIQRKTAVAVCGEVIGLWALVVIGLLHRFALLGGGYIQWYALAAILSALPAMVAVALLGPLRADATYRQKSHKVYRKRLMKTGVGGGGRGKLALSVVSVLGTAITGRAIAWNSSFPSGGVALNATVVAACCVAALPWAIWKIVVEVRRHHFVAGVSSV